MAKIEKSFKNFDESLKSLSEGVNFKKCLKCGSDFMLATRNKNLISWRCQNCGVSGEKILSEKSSYTNNTPFLCTNNKEEGKSEVYPLKWRSVWVMKLTDKEELERLREYPDPVPYNGRMQELSSFCVGYWRKCLSCSYFTTNDTTFCLLHSILYGEEELREVRLDLWKWLQKHKS